MKNEIAENLQLYADRLAEKVAALEDAKWRLQQAKRDLADGKRGTKRAKSPEVKAVLKALGPAATRLSLVYGTIYVESRNAASSRIDPGLFKLVSSRTEGFTVFAEFQGIATPWLRITNIYDPRLLVV